MASTALSAIIYATIGGLVLVSLIILLSRRAYRNKREHNVDAMEFGSGQSTTALMEEIHQPPVTVVDQNVARHSIDSTLPAYETQAQQQQSPSSPPYLRIDPMTTANAPQAVHV
ncbi:hypothetical protein COEREDRAFT_7841 [Coemansia reversa NRRL 1564]|uniref:Uncharacterized protein n=1 Tax=Coemansia reversa (strain ATCC 12441 / NRRL 1564) TaxID=763665 RepID=A0A2G5BDJ0_COERN|nr:hypothetical protein COEREDRAFT_7841 [Coemansia reversa NRRL 1564]|eukprot:PIA17075.1 hypothetical protein COEREDRAFT_7841 [Coemansia reversa NRRL 1564]